MTSAGKWMRSGQASRVINPDPARESWRLVVRFARPATAPGSRKSPTTNRLAWAGIGESGISCPTKRTTGLCGSPVRAGIADGLAAAVGKSADRVGRSVPRFRPWTQLVGRVRSCRPRRCAHDPGSSPPPFDAGSARSVQSVRHCASGRPPVLPTTQRPRPWRGDPKGRSPRPLLSGAVGVAGIIPPDSDVPKVRKSRGLE